MVNAAEELNQVLLEVRNVGGFIFCQKTFVFLTKFSVNFKKKKFVACLLY